MTFWEINLKGKELPSTYSIDDMIDRYGVDVVKDIIRNQPKTIGDLEYRVFIPDEELKEIIGLVRKNRGTAPAVSSIN